MFRNNLFSIYIFTACLLISTFSCNNKSENPDAEIIVNAEDAIDLMKVEEGFKVVLVAAEPLVVAPVAMNFDDRGRLWVVEMTGYMPDTDGEGENAPNGKIIILEDEDGDGRMDIRKVFLENLVLPRAISFVENGILVAEPPALWYYEIENDKPGKKILVDSLYAASGNVEHQPNALYRAMDNWIYSAEGTVRYRKSGDQWLKEAALLRGQWGISQDDFGRLFYNNNSQNLLGDFFPPAFVSSSGNQHSIKGFNERIVEDNRVYPARPTPGVNRGNLEGVLDEEMKLINFTAASGPVIYRGNLFSEEYYGNAFVGEPAAHLIKRNILSYTDTVTGRQAYEEKEFLSSTDERFRPVTVYNGPDGALYFADMYRGIIQHKTYLTPYLKEHIVSKGLNYPLNCGRIYKVIPETSKPLSENLVKSPGELVELLQHSNGWVRDKAQQLLSDSKDTSIILPLKKLLEENNKKVFSKYHAAWVLEALNALNQNDIINLLNGNKEDRLLAYSLFTGMNINLNLKTILPVLEKHLKETDNIETAWMVYALNVLNKNNDPAVRNFLISMAGKFPDDRYVTPALVYAATDREMDYLKIYENRKHTDSLFSKMINRSVQIKKERSNSNRQENIAKRFPKGSALYMQVCKVCHGETGSGIESLAPALNKSEIVTGTAEKFIAVALLGITSSADEKEKPGYADMPGIWINENISDKDLSELLSFIRQSWQNDAGMITEEDVRHVKNKFELRKDRPVSRNELKKGLETHK